VRDEASNCTPNPRHDRSSAGSVILGSPERSPGPDEHEEHSGDLATGLRHDFDYLRDSIGQLELVADGLHEFHNRIEQRERDFRAEIEQQNITIDKLKKKVKEQDDVASGMGEIVSSLGKLRTENADLKAQIDELKGQNEKFKERNSKAKAQNDELRAKEDELKVQHDELMTKKADSERQLSSEKAGLKAENAKLKTKQLILEKQVYTFQRLYVNSKKCLPSCDTCDENLKQVNEFFAATLQNLPDQDWDSYTPTNNAIGHIKSHHDAPFRLSNAVQNAGGHLTGRPTGSTTQNGQSNENVRNNQQDPRHEKSAPIETLWFKNLLRDNGRNSPKPPAKSMSTQATKRKPTEEPQHHDPKRQRNDSKVSKEMSKLLY
jgi:ParB-like chromosome segregation protein Spo0J